MSLRGRKIKGALAPYALIAPTVVLVLVFIYGVVNGVLQGFGIMPFLGKTEFTLQYYLEAFGRADFTASLGFSLYISAVSSALAVVGGIVLSAALTRLSASRALQAVGISIPLMTAHTLVVLFVVSLFAGTGLVPRALYALGLIDGIGAFPSVVGDPSGWGIVLVYLCAKGRLSRRFSSCSPSRSARTRFRFCSVRLCRRRYLFSLTWNSRIPIS